MIRVLRTALPVLPIVVLWACGASPGTPFRAVVDTKTLTAEVIERQAQIVWDAVGSVDTPEGTKEIRPTTDEDWIKVKAAAINLTEAGNLLMMAPRAQDGDRWIENVQRMMTQGERLIAASERKNAQEIFDVGADLYEACVACHTRYMPDIKDMYR